MRLYLIRHGQSVTNLERKFTGWAQAPLTEPGREDARRAGGKLAGLTFDRIYSSDLIRAVQTAQEALPGCEPVQLKELREISVGSLEWRPIADCEREYGDKLWNDRNKYDFTPYGGEKGQKLTARVRAFLKMLEEDPAERIAAFAHAGFIQCMLRVVLKQDVDRTLLKCANGSVSVFEYAGGRWILESWNM